MWLASPSSNNTNNVCNVNNNGYVNNNNYNNTNNGVRPLASRKTVVIYTICIIREVFGGNKPCPLVQFVL